MSFERKSDPHIEKKAEFDLKFPADPQKKASLLKGEIPADELKLVKKLGEDKSGEMFLATYRRGRVAIKVFNYSKQPEAEVLKK